MATATLDWSQCPAVESVPGRLSGAWVFRDTRLPVATVIENLEDLSVDEVMEQFDVTRETDCSGARLRGAEPQGASSGHTVITSGARGWDRLSNGVLLQVA
jgi:uncharacterized protein (DUF433 family)